MPRKCGVFLPVSALPGPYGSGGFGEEARYFIDKLAEAQVSYWQILPFTYSHETFYPYQAQSSQAKHHLFIDPAGLVKEGLLHEAETVPPFAPSPNHISPGALAWKHLLLERAYARFMAGKAPHLSKGFKEFILAHPWLPDFALYAVLGRHFNHTPWQQWPAKLRDRQPQALDEWELRMHTEIYCELFAQFLLDSQWQEVLQYAHNRGIQVIGDIPIYSAADSVETWTQRHLYQLDVTGMPLYISGSPPDMFSPKGQAWDTPLYDWGAAAAESFTSSVQRIANQFQDVDMVRLDHLIGYVRYWSIPFGEKTQAGKWMDGPGSEFFAALKKAVPAERFIGESLGLNTPETEAAFKQFGAPTMRLLSEDLELGILKGGLMYEKPVVVYSSTHDSDTLVGWYEKTSSSLKLKLSRWWALQGLTELPLQYRFLCPLLDSPAHLVVIPLEDIAGLGNSARINVPGTLNDKNWIWRVRWDEVSATDWQMLKKAIKVSGRLP